ncbi:MAG: hypothetical protein B6I28_04825 [Fusobacteriia bacterium 4572_132]|nr:MAG: hypothetical protein B6I28_04825 [Fusobacteriia bacterium 4572_132]
MSKHKIYYLHPGDIFVTNEKYLIKTILGSCVSIILWDKKKKIGGINHFVLSGIKMEEENGRYGEIAIPKLVKAILNKGAYIENLVAIIVGGARNKNLSAKVGEMNIYLAKEILEKNKIKVKKIIYGGEVGRKVIFDTFSGEVKIINIGGEGYEKN